MSFQNNETTNFYIMYKIQSIKYINEGEEQRPIDKISHSTNIRMIRRVCFVDAYRYPHSTIKRVNWFRMGKKKPRWEHWRNFPLENDSFSASFHEHYCVIECGYNVFMCVCFVLSVSKREKPQSWILVQTKAAPLS